MKDLRLPILGVSTQSIFGVATSLGSRPERGRRVTGRVPLGLEESPLEHKSYYVLDWYTTTGFLSKLY